MTSSLYRRQLLEEKAVTLYRQGLTVREVAEMMKNMGLKRSRAWVGALVKRKKLSTERPRRNL